MTSRLLTLSLALVPILACQVVSNVEEKTEAPPAAVLPNEPSPAPAGSCEEGARTCEGQSPRVCTGGELVEEAACSGATPICANGKCVANRSCSGAPSAPGTKSDCGGQSGTTDCCDSRKVAGGKFLRNYDGVPGAIIPHDDKGYPATVSSFHLDTFEVTVGRFRAFVNAGQGTQAHPPAAGAGKHPRIKDTGWDALWSTRLEPDTVALASALECGTLNKEPITWTKTAGDHERMPLLCANWYEAFAFCAWDGGRLPTNAELNYAASGGSEQRLYPWGSAEYDETRAFRCTGDCTGDDFAVVGSHPLGNGKWGHTDLAGSVSEWVFDSAMFPSPECVDCAMTKDTLSRYTRGGGYISLPQLEMVSAMEKQRFATDRLGMGFRCARDR